MTDNPLGAVLRPMGALLAARHEDRIQNVHEYGLARTRGRVFAGCTPRPYACFGSVGLKTRPTRFKTLAGPSFLRVEPVILTRCAHQAG